MSVAGQGFLLEVKRASLQYPGGPRVLEDARLTVEEGELVALVGPNGGGKTTLLRLIAGVAPGFYKANASGLIVVEGRELRPGDPMLRSSTALLQPDPQLQVVGLTPFHEALLAPIIRRETPQQALEEALKALSEVGLEGWENTPTSYLSTGLLQRAGLAGLLTSRPRILLLDEPTSHLDPPFRKRVPQLLQRLASSRSLGIIVASQDPQLASEANRVYCVQVRVWECTGSWREWLEEYTAHANVPPPRLSPLLREGGGSKHTEEGEPVVEARGVSAGYPGGRGVLNRVSLRANQGELVALVGPNGGGKTTLLRLIAGLISPREGWLRVRYRPAYLPSEPLLVFSRGTLGEELEGAQPPLELPESIVASPVTHLSRGQLQLAALSLILARSPSRLLLLDEPTFALDPGWSRLVRGLLARLSREAGYTILAATHDEELVATADRVYRVEEGRVWEQ